MSRFSTRTKVIAGGAALFLLGTFAGGAASRHLRPVPAMAPATQQSIASIAGADRRQIVAVRGQVSGVFGSSFTLKDQSGQTLIETGHRGRTPQTALVSAGQTVTVQGHVRDGGLRAMFIVTPDGKAWAVGVHGHGGKHGGRHDRGFGPDEAPPAPSAPPAAGSPPTP